MKNKLLLEISRVRNLMGLLTEDEIKTISDENSFIKYLEENGFKKIDPTNSQEVEMIENKFLPSEFKIGTVDFIYFNEKNNGYCLKWKSNLGIKERLNLGTFGNYIPKKGERMPKKSLSVIFPIRIDWTDEFIKPELDLNWDSQSLAIRLDTAKNSYYNYLKLNDKGQLTLVSNNEILNPNFVDSYKRGIKNVIDEVEKILPTIPVEEQNKQVTSKQFNQTYSKISDYIEEIKNDSSKLGLFDMPIVSNPNSTNVQTTNKTKSEPSNNTKQTDDIEGFIVEPFND